MTSSESKRLMGWKPFIYGGCASIAAEICTFPIDASKTRLQLQGELIFGKQVRFSHGPYGGMLDCLFSIWKHEGFVSLYRGITAAITRQITYGALKIGMYNNMKCYFVPTPEDETLITNVFCAALSGSISNAICNPTDILKVRLQAYSLLGREKPSLIGLLVKSVEQEGLMVLYKGVGPTALRAAVVGGAELPIYDITKKNLLLSGVLEDTKLCHFISSFIAGFGGALVSNPIDVTRTRLMNQRRANGISRTNYTSSIGCLFQTIKNEGAFALWKGFIPNWFRLGPWNVVFFMTFEQLQLLPF